MLLHLLTEIRKLPAELMLREKLELLSKKLAGQQTAIVGHIRKHRLGGHDLLSKGSRQQESLVQMCPPAEI